MSTIAHAPPQPVEIHRRRYMTSAEKVRRWEELGRVCAICRLPCDPYGHTVIWDHFLALALGGTNEISNMECHHRIDCAAIKTARDMEAIARAKRRERKHSEPSAPGKIRSRGFDRTKTRKFNGQVVSRQSPSGEMDQ